MKRIFKRIIAMLLVSSMCMTSAPVTALADEIPQALQDEQTSVTDVSTQELATVQPEETPEPEQPPVEEPSTEQPPAEDGSTEENPEISTEAPEEGSTEEGNKEETESTEESTENESAENPTEEGSIDIEEGSSEESTDISSDSDAETDKEKADEEDSEKRKEEKKRKKSKKDRKEKKEKKSKIKVIEVGDLASFTAAVQIETAGDDLTPAYEFEKNSKKVYVHGEEKWDVTLETVASISDYEVVEQKNTVELINPWQNKRLLVRSPMGFDPKNAVSIIQGYDSMFIITYETEEDTKAAYEYLLTIPYLTVETDASITAMTTAMEPVSLLKETEETVMEPEVLAEDVDTQTEQTEQSESTEEMTEVVEESVKADLSQVEIVSREIPQENMADTIVAVLDTGYDMNGDITGIVGGTDLTGSGTLQDENGHGTALSNLILDNTKDVVKVMPVKVADGAGHSSSLKIYLGIRHALEAGADMINISMTSYKPSDNGIVKAVIEEAAGRNIPVIAAAGNFGESTENYIPAGVDTAIVVSAVNADKTRDTYSNYGATVDYCASGSVEARSVNNEMITISGTSVSAAIATAVASGVLAKKGNIFIQELTAILNEMAEDLGDAGRDAYFGNGLLSLEGLKGLEEEDTEIELPELLTCDWKSKSTEELNELIMSTPEFFQKRFLDDMSEADKAELLAKEGICYNQQFVKLIYDPLEEAQLRFEGTLMEFLYSTYCDEYILQKKIFYEFGNKTYYLAGSNGTVTLLKCTCGKAKDKCECKDGTTIRYNQYPSKGTFTEDGTLNNSGLPESGVNQTNYYTVVITATQGTSSFNFSNMTLRGRVLGGTDEEGVDSYSRPSPKGVFVDGITVAKAKHTRATGQSKSYTYSMSNLFNGGYYYPYASTTVNVEKNNNLKQTVVTSSGNYEESTGQFLTLSDGTKHVVTSEGGIKVSYDSANNSTNTCESEQIENLGVLLGTGDVADDANQIFRLRFTTYDHTEGEWSEYSVVTKGSCTTNGVMARTKTFTCNYCNAAASVQTETATIYARGHNYLGSATQETWITETPATCTEPGEEWCYCTNTEDTYYVDCNEFKTRELEALGHDWGDDQHEDCPDSLNPQVTVEDGIKYHICNRCDLKEIISYRWLIYNAEQLEDLSGYAEGRVCHDKYYGLGSIFPGRSADENAIFRSATRVEEQEVKGAHLDTVYSDRRVAEILYDPELSEEEMETLKNFPENGQAQKGTSVWESSMYKYTIPDMTPEVEGKKFVCWEYTTFAYVVSECYPGDTIYFQDSFSSVTLRAVWEDEIKITLDNQGADEGKEGTKEVYLNPGDGHYKDADFTQRMHRITLPEKTETLENGEKRAMYFNGYYKEKNGSGGTFASADGGLNPYYEGGSYTKPTESTTVYAHWLSQYTVTFDANLSEADLAILNKKENDAPIVTNPTPSDIVTLPDSETKIEGKEYIVTYKDCPVKEASVMKDMYRFKGWSRTPDGSSGIILDENTTSYTIEANVNKDITLYAQWDTSFQVAYMGNVQSGGKDYLDAVEDIEGTYTFNPNEPQQVALLLNDEADYFEKTVEKETVDVETGEDITEEVPCSFQGWSMYKDRSDQELKDKYLLENGEQQNSKMINDARESNALTIGAPKSDFGTYDAPHPDATELVAGVYGETPAEGPVADYLADLAEMPYVNMYVIWDEYPQIHATDIYLSLAEAHSGMITEEYLLDFAAATDEELKDATTNPDGIMENGVDDVANTSFSIPDYQAAEFSCAEGEMSVTLTYQAVDAAGNTTSKMVHIYLVDTDGKDIDTGEVRFISKEYIDTLDEDSIWRTGEYAEKLDYVLNNSKSDVEYTSPTAAQQAFGAESVEKPGSGTWSHVQEVWEFTHEEVEEIQAYVDANKGAGDPADFLNLYGGNRVS